MNEQEFKALKALVMVQGAVIQGISWKIHHSKETKEAIHNAYAPLIRAANQAVPFDKEYATALEMAYRETLVHLALP